MCIINNICFLVIQTTIDDYMSIATPWTVEPNLATNLGMVKEDLWLFHLHSRRRWRNMKENSDLKRMLLFYAHRILTHLKNYNILVLIKQNKNFSLSSALRRMTWNCKSSFLFILILFQIIFFFVSIMSNKCSSYFLYSWLYSKIISWPMHEASKNFFRGLYEADTCLNGEVLLTYKILQLCVL